MAKKAAKKAIKRPVKKAAKKTPTQAAPKGPSAAEAIHKLGAVFMKSVAAKDSRALVSGFYAPDAVLMPPNQPAIVGRENIRLALQGMMDAGVTSLKLETLEIGSSGDRGFDRLFIVLSRAANSGIG